MTRRLTEAERKADAELEIRMQLRLLSPHRRQPLKRALKTIARYGVAELEKALAAK